MSDHLIAEANRHAKALPVNPDRLALAIALQTIDELERENAELADFVERHEDALRLLRIWAAKPMHGTNCDDLREETLAFLKTQ